MLMDNSVSAIDDLEVLTILMHSSLEYLPPQMFFLANEDYCAGCISVARGVCWSAYLLLEECVGLHICC